MDSEATRRTYIEGPICGVAVYELVEQKPMLGVEQKIVYRHMGIVESIKDAQRWCAGDESICPLQVYSDDRVQKAIHDFLDRGR